MSMYGFESAEVNVSPLQFGLNRKMRLVKFEFNANGGKDNAPQDVLDIQFQSENGGYVNYRQFPVTRAYDNGQEITDPNHEKFKKEVSNFNRKITQIMTCFMTEDEYKEALQSQPITSFKQFAIVLRSLLPQDLNDLPLIDVFARYKWSPKQGDTRKYLELPKNVQMGKVFVTCENEDLQYDAYKFHNQDMGGRISKLVDGEYVEVEGAEFSGEGKKMVAKLTVGNNEITFNERKALQFISESGEVHPISRNSWFLGSNWSKANNDETEEETTDWE